MHQAAVIILCFLVVYFAWQDVVWLFIDWYSAVEPPISTKTKVLIWIRTVIVLVAVVVALATL